MSVLAVIPCGAQKLERPAPARDLYTGQLFVSALRAAEVVVARRGGEVMVLSALHGLVGLDRPLEPYDVTVGDPGSIEPSRLAGQVPTVVRMLLLLPSRYDALMVEALGGLRPPNPLRGASGIGDIRGRLGRIERGELDPWGGLPDTTFAAVNDALRWDRPELGGMRARVADAIKHDRPLRITQLTSVGWCEREVQPTTHDESRWHFLVRGERVPVCLSRVLAVADPTPLEDADPQAGLFPVPAHEAVGR